MAFLDEMSYKIAVVPSGVDKTVWLSQNENGRELYFDITDTEIPADSTVTISGTKPDGVVYSAVGTLDGNTARFEEDTQLTAVAGEWIAKIRVTNGGNTVATARIRFVIDADPVKEGSVPSDSELEGLVAEAQQYAETARTEAYGSPLTANTAAEMTQKDRVYVYTGSETGYTAGSWYYWNGSAWTLGGVYNSQAIQTDTGLTIAGMAADAKATGEAITAAEEGAVAEALASVAPEYSNTATYAVGDYVVHNGQLYQCVTAIEAGEEWTAAKWTAAKIAQDVTRLKEDLQTLDRVSLYSVVGDTNIFRQGTQVTASSNAITTINNVNLDNTTAIVDTSDDSTFRMVMYAKNGGTALGYLTDVGFTDTISAATVFIEVDISDLNSEYDWYVTVFNSTGSGLDLETSAQKVLFVKSIVSRVEENVANIKNPYEFVADDDLFRQGTATNTSNVSSITTLNPVQPEVTQIKSTLTNFIFALYARSKAGVGVGYLTADNTFTATYSQSLFSADLDFKSVQRMFPQYNFYVTAKMSNGTTISPSSHGNFITFVKSDFVELENELYSICPIYGKKVVCFGDSIFGMYRDTSWADESIPSMIATLTKASCYNAGMGGTRACPSGAANDSLSFSSIATAIVDADWTDQDTFLASVTDHYAQYYYDNIAYLKTLDFSAVDIITVSYGTNDWSASVTLADYEAGLRNGITALLTKYPNLTVVICTPTIRFLPDGAGAAWEYDSDDARAENNNGNKISDYASTCVLVGHGMHFPVVDMYWSLGINGLNKSVYFGDASGVHPVRAGRELIARRLAGELNKM